MQEASARLGNPMLHKKSLEITKIGDSWRNFAYDCGRMVKDRADGMTYQGLADQLSDIGKREINFFTSIHKMNF